MPQQLTALAQTLDRNKSALPVPTSTDWMTTVHDLQLVISGQRYITNSIGMQFAPIPLGKFVMGSPESEAERRDGTIEMQHLVRLTRDFLIGVMTVTQSDYQCVMGFNPSHFSSSGQGAPIVRGLDTSQ